MRRRLFVSVTVVTAAVLWFSALDALAAGTGIFGLRNRYRRPAPTRTYRSYSVSPGAADVAADGLDASGTAVVPRPVPAASQARKRVPSYMRGDSKAQGRFGQ